MDSLKINLNKLKFLTNLQEFKNIKNFYGIQRIGKYNYLGL